MHKRVSKRKGFTLLEMVVVIAIIVMLATVTISSVVNYIKWSNEQKAKVANHDTAIDRAQQDVDSYLVGFTRPTTPSETTDNTPHPGPGPGGNPGGNPGGGGGGGGAPTEPSITSGDETDPTVEPPSENQDAPGSNTALFTSNNWFGSQLKFDQPVTKFVVVTDGNNFDINCGGQYTKTYLGNGRYEITFVAGSWGSSYHPLTSIDFHIDNGFTKCYIERYEAEI